MIEGNLKVVRREGDCVVCWLLMGAVGCNGSILKKISARRPGTLEEFFCFTLGGLASDKKVECAKSNCGLDKKYAKSDSVPPPPKGEQ